MTELTEKQKKVLGLRADGYLNKQISAMLKISEVTIHQHLRACCKKLEATNTAHAIALASAAGIFSSHQRTGSGETQKQLHLTSRDRQILQQVAKGSTNVQIAAEFDISLKTVETCFQRMALRNGTSGRMSLAMLGIQTGQITL